MNDEVVYYLIRFATTDAEDDYQKLLTYLSEQDYTKVTHNSATEVVVSYKDEPHILMDLGEFSRGDSYPKRPALVCRHTPGDTLAFSLLQHVSHKFQYKIFSSALRVFLPDRDLQEVSQRILDEKIAEIFTKKHFHPLFRIDQSLVFYGYVEGMKSVHIINPGMMEYFRQFGVQEGENTPEFSYEVAPSLEQFVALWGVDAVPRNSFYEYYEKSKRIMNYSRMDVWRVQRKIFVKPYSFTYHAETQSYELYTADKAALNNASKIMPGENLDRALLRMTREWIKLAPDYTRAVVMPDVQFDRDSANKLTPLLIVRLLFPEVATSEKPATAQRGWVSLKNVVS